MAFIRVMSLDRNEEILSQGQSNVFRAPSEDSLPLNAVI